MSDFPKIEVNVSEAGIGTIKIDGVDISDKVSGADIRIRVNEVTQVSIIYAASTAIETNGMIAESTVDGYTRKRLAQ